MFLQISSDFIGPGHYIRKWRRYKTWFSLTALGNVIFQKVYCVQETEKLDTTYCY
jgi:hypothetical protein